MLTLVAFVVVLVAALWQPWRLHIEVVNATGARITDVAVAVASNGAQRALLEPGEAWRCRLDVGGDSNVWISWIGPDLHPVQRTLDTELVRGDWGSIELELTPQRTCRWHQHVLALWFQPMRGSSHEARF